MDSITISAILLAAGESRRMGEFKQLLPFRGKPFVVCCVENLLASRVAEIIVITGYRGAEVKEALADYSIKITFNSDYQLGMGSSVKCGIRATRKDATAFLLALADQPQISTQMINRVIAAYEEAMPLIAIPRYREKNGHPIIFSSLLREEALAMGVETGLKPVIHAHRAQTLFVEVEDDLILTDFDTPEDFQRFPQDYLLDSR